MSKPIEIETAEYELMISPSAGRDRRARSRPSTNVHVDFSAVSHTGKVRLA